MSEKNNMSGKAAQTKSANAVPAVKAEQVHKAFGSAHILKGIDMTVMPGTVTVILGPSGSGKSTFLRLVNQMETITGGSIEVCGYDVEKQSVQAKMLRAAATVAIILTIFFILFLIWNITQHIRDSEQDSCSPSSREKE